MDSRRVWSADYDERGKLRNHYDIVIFEGKLETFNQLSLIVKGACNGAIGLHFADYSEFGHGTGVESKIKRIGNVLSVIHECPTVDEVVELHYRRRQSERKLSGNIFALMPDRHLISALTELESRNAANLDPLATHRDRIIPISLGLPNLPDILKTNFTPLLDVHMKAAPAKAKLPWQQRKDLTDRSARKID